MFPYYRQDSEEDAEDLGSTSLLEILLFLLMIIHMISILRRVKS